MEATKQQQKEAPLLFVSFVSFCKELSQMKHRRFIHSTAYWGKAR